MAVLVLLALAVFLVRTEGALFLIWAVMGGLFIFMVVRARRARALEGKVTRAGELAMLRHDRAALRMSWRLLPELTGVPPLHQRCVAIVGHCLDQIGAYESSLVVYDYLLEVMTGSPAGAVQLRIQRAIVALACDHLADADDALRSLRGQVGESHTPAPVRAAYRLATLVQDVRTAHFADAIEGCGGLIDELRPLGVEAGFGHALMAFCYHRMGQQQGHEQAQTPKAPTDYLQAAARWWTRATLLVPAKALVHRFPELGKMSEALDG